MSSLRQQRNPAEAPQKQMARVYHSVCRLAKSHRSDALAGARNEQIKPRSRGFLPQIVSPVKAKMGWESGPHYLNKFDDLYGM